MQVKITETYLATLTLPPGVARLKITDTEDVGFCAIKGATEVTFGFRHYQRGKETWETIGHHKTMTVEEARQGARARAGRRAEGIATPGDLLRAKKSGPTLREAAEEYLAYLTAKRKQPRTQKDVRNEILKAPYVQDWLERPMRDLSAKEIQARHALLSERKLVHNGRTYGGIYVANRVFRWLSAIWTRISKPRLIDDATWPRYNITDAVNWCKTEPRRDRVSWSGLPAWQAAVTALSSPVRRDYNLLILFSGFRAEDCATMRWDHINTTNAVAFVKVWNSLRKRNETKTLPPRSVLRPSPKGGRDKMFVIPMSAEAVRILDRRRAENKGDNGWVFPGWPYLKDKLCDMCKELGLPEMHKRGEVGHMGCPSEWNREHIVGPHQLRHTYATAAEEAKIPTAIISVLMNHRYVTKTVTDRYIQPDHDFLAECQEKVTQFLLSKMQPIP